MTNMIYAGLSPFPRPGTQASQHTRAWAQYMCAGKRYPQENQQKQNTNLIHKHKWYFGFRLPMKDLLAAVASIGRCTEFRAVNVVGASVHNRSIVHSPSKTPKYSKLRQVIVQDQCILQPVGILRYVVVLMGRSEI